ncbi:MAG: sel1 repeat family protein [Verrucomicrobia bacterium]|nr:sel1 repeat family protein [Verrucomicrobiota bacterium]
MRRSWKNLVGISVLCLLIAGGLVMAVLWYREPGDGGPAQPAEPRPDFNQTQARAEAGEAQAQNLVGELYAEGKQVKRDFAEAIRWYRKAADQGLARAQYNLGVLHDIGQGVPQDEAEAARWYRQAAENGSADAQYTLASMYGLGRGVPRDPKEALRWYERAAEQGDALARYNLAERYERGKDVAPDLAEAYKWHSLAAERGLKDAASARDSLGRRMNSDQLAEARKRIRDFNQKFPARSESR